MEMGRKLIGSLKSLVLGRRITSSFLRLVGNTLLRIDKLYIYIGERLNYIIYGRASFNRNGLILSCPMDLSLCIIVIYLPTSRTVIGGIIKLSLGFNCLLQKSLSDLEQAKLSEINPLDCAKVSANVKK